MPIATYLAEGNTIPHTPGSALDAGDVVDLGDLIGITTQPIAANTLGSLAITGRFSVTKKTGETWSTVGAPVYWDAGTESFSTDVSYSEAAAGFVAVAAASGDATGEIILTPGIVRS